MSSLVYLTAAPKQLRQMASPGKKRIFLLDPQRELRQSFAKCLQQVTNHVRCFESGQTCLEALAVTGCDLIVTARKLPDMDVLTLLVRAQRIFPRVPVIVVAAERGVPQVVRAIRSGSVDFIEKPLASEDLQQRVASMLKQAEVRPLPAYAHTDLKNTGITLAEMRVLRLILDGKSNRETARILNRSEKTVEVHRRRIMRKLGVENTVDLVKKAFVIGLLELPASKLREL